jgi:hypothetical protein
MRWVVGLAIVASSVLGSLRSQLAEVARASSVGHEMRPAAREATTPRHERVTRRHLHGPIDPAVVEVANALLDLPMGDARTVEVKGRPYVFVVEPHYHPPGYERGPNGWHKGVTVYELL